MLHILELIVWSVLLVVETILLVNTIKNVKHDKKMREYERVTADAKLTEIMSQTVLNTIKAQNLINDKEEK